VSRATASTISVGGSSPSHGGCGFTPLSTISMCFARVTNSRTSETSAHISLPHGLHICCRPGYLSRISGLGVATHGGSPQAGCSCPRTPRVSAGLEKGRKARRDTPTGGHPTTSGHAGMGCIRCQSLFLEPGSPTLGDGREAKATDRS